LTDLQVIESVVEASLPRSIVIRKDPEDAALEAQNKLLMIVGNGDGSVTTRKLCLEDLSSSRIVIDSRNSLAMGKTPVHLAASSFEAESSRVLCVSDRVSILYEEQERLSRSAFNLSVSCRGQIKHQFTI
jgi:hypothetical protein